MPRNRCHFIGIYTPQDDALKRVTFCRERIIEDGDGVMLGKTLEQPSDLVVPFLPSLATTVRTVVDPLTGVEVTFSGAALATWMTAEYEAQNLADITPVPDPVPEPTNE